MGEKLCQLGVLSGKTPGNAFDVTVERQGVTFSCPPQQTS